MRVSISCGLSEFRFWIRIFAKSFFTMKLSLPLKCLLAIVNTTHIIILHIFMENMLNTVAHLHIQQILSNISINLHLSVLICFGIHWLLREISVSFLKLLNAILCLPAVWSWEMRAVRVKQNSKVAGPTEKTINLKMLKHCRDEEDCRAWW